MKFLQIPIIFVIIYFGMLIPLEKLNGIKEKVNASAVPFSSSIPNSYG